MRGRGCVGVLGRGIGAGLRVAVTTYLAYAAVAWCRYGRAGRVLGDAERDRLLDEVMPEFEVRVAHRVNVRAPAETTMQVMRELDLLELPMARSIFRAREVMLRAKPDEVSRPHGLIAFMESIGWRIVAEDPGREVVFGAAMQPWQADVVFRGLGPNEFAAFREPGYAKVAWTLRVDPDGPQQSVTSTETRVLTTDSVSRAKFRRYWALASPGMFLIRMAALGAVKREAERRSRGS